jgi:SagB-type dehydrogenase family enzyme
VALQRVSGFSDGLYLLCPEDGRLYRYGEDERLPVALGGAVLDQRWVGLAQLNFLFFAPLAEIVERWGSGIYREFGFAAGGLAQRLYLGAESLGLGGCGVGAFYDDELANAFHLPAACAPLYLMAVGGCKRGKD